MLMRGDSDAAIRHLDIYLATHSDRSWHYRARELRADALYQADDQPAAQQEYKEAISEAPSPDKVSPHCYLRIAETYEDSGDRDAAVLAYRRFLDLFPSTSQAASVEKKIQTLTAEEGKMEPSSSNGSYVIEAGVFASEQQAVGLVLQLRRLGYQPYVVTRTTSETKSFSVRLGPYEFKAAALATSGRLKREAGIETTLLPQAAQF
jgi:cell division septation protein DedD